MKLTFPILAAIAAAGLATNQRALAQHFDIFLARPAAGTQTVIGGADVGGAAYDDVTRIFEVELASAAGEYLALEPGVNHPNINNPLIAAYPGSAVALQPGDALRLLAREFAVDGATSDLFFWNGVGSVSFAPAVANFRIDGGDPLGSLAGAGGAFDDHPFLVVDDDSLPGIYLASAVGVVDGYAPSDPVYLVMGSEDLVTAEFLGVTPAEFDMLTDEELGEELEKVIERGVAYVEAKIVPEPATSVLAGTLALAALVGFRRRALCSRAAPVA
jgi:hypothetical protein